MKEVELPKQAELTTQRERKGAEQRRATERKIDRRKRYAERKARQIATARMKQRQLEENLQSLSWHMTGLKNLTSTCSRT